jgi:hypothetical protein
MSFISSFSNIFTFYPSFFEQVESFFLFSGILCLFSSFGHVQDFSNILRPFSNISCLFEHVYVFPSFSNTFCLFRTNYAFSKHNKSFFFLFSSFFEQICIFPPFSNILKFSEWLFGSMDNWGCWQDNLLSDNSSYFYTHSTNPPKQELRT